MAETLSTLHHVFEEFFKFREIFRFFVIHRFIRD